MKRALGVLGAALLGTSALWQLLVAHDVAAALLPGGLCLVAIALMA